MQLIDSVSSVSLVQFEVFAVAALLSAGLFSVGFLLGRVSKKGQSVKVPMEVLHALATTRFDAGRLDASRFDARGGRDKDSHADAILHAIEAVLDHVHHEKDFKKAQEYALHEIDKTAHDHGATPELTDLHKKVEHAHNKAEIEAALHAFIEHGKGHH